VSLSPPAAAPHLHLLPPALATEAQVALTLRLLGGLSTEQVARAFLVAEPTMAQRLVRAKRKIKGAQAEPGAPGLRVARHVFLGLGHETQIWFWRFAVWVIPVLVGLGAHRSCGELPRFEATRQAELEASRREGTQEGREMGRPSAD
jgi:hypothetical protein